MKRCLTAWLFVLLAAGVVCGQTRSGWLRGEWAGTAYQLDSESMWPMVLNFGRGRYTAEYPSLECAGRWHLLSVTRTRAIFRETVTSGAERCAPRGRVVIERLNARQLGYRYAYQGSKDYVASAILNGSAAQAPRLGSEFKLKAGRVFKLDGGRLWVRLVRVVSDSRCPADVDCVWAGNAELLFEVGGSGWSGKQALTLNTNASPERPGEGRYGSYTLKLLGLTPQPRSTGKIAPAQYTATLLVTKE